MDTSIETALRGLLAQRGKRALSDPSLTPAAVLMLVYPKNGVPHVLFTRRTEAVQYHKGEVSLPGGARDPSDSTLLETALREAQEEVGIAPEDVTVLGELDETPTESGFAIHAFVGTIPQGYRFRPNPVEAAEVIEMPLFALVAPENRRAETRWVHGRPVEACSFVYGGHLIWGATARIVKGLGEVLEASGQKGATGER